TSESRAPSNRNTARDHLGIRNHYPDVLVLHRFDENMGTEGLRQSAKLSETFGIIRICLLTSDRQEFA
ncbi:hypothetical protein PYV00_21150, partial [Novosphingobium sp. H3SJ31-1]